MPTKALMAEVLWRFFWEAERARRDSNPGSPAPKASYIEYYILRKPFLLFLNRYEGRNAKNILSYLDRFLAGKRIEGPMDIMRIFNGTSPGQSHHLDRALRAFLNFCLSMGYPEAWISQLKRAIPRDPDFLDLRVPEEREILASLESLESSGFIPKYRVLFHLLLDSGIRLTEAVMVVNGFDEGKLVKIGEEVYRYPLAFFRGQKYAFHAYFTEHSLAEMRENRKKLSDKASSKYFESHGLVAPKYLRKFAFEKMVELGIPESVADFIQGRVPQRIGARHYMRLTKQADLFFKKYAAYVEQLRKKEAKGLKLEGKNMQLGV